MSTAAAAAAADTGAADAAAAAAAATADKGAAAAAPTWYSDVKDWREQIAGGDKAKLNTLKRYTDPGALATSFFEAQEKIRKGEVSSGLPKDPTPEQLTAYREANGVPSTAAEYKLKMPDGIEFGDADKATFTPLLERLHARHIPNDVASEIVGDFMLMEAKELENMTVQHNLDKQTVTRQLKDVWKGDYDQNINLIKGMFTAALPAEMLDQFFSARMGNGKALFNTAEAMTAFADMARRLNPAAMLVPNVSNPRQSLEGRKKELEGMMRQDGWHSKKAENQEYVDILDALASMKQQGQ